MDDSVSCLNVYILLDPLFALLHQTMWHIITAENELKNVFLHSKIIRNIV